MRVAVVCLVVLASSCARPTPELTVSVAASLQNVLEQLAPAFGRARVRLNFGASGMLAQQIEQGAPADVFFSAAPQPVDRLASIGLVLERRDLLRNEIVLIAPEDSTRPDSFSDLAAVSLLAIGDPASVPAGDYGRQVLESLNLWQALQNKLVLTKDVRQVLTYVETGNAPAGIVYATDARTSLKVRIAAVAPVHSHTPVLYPVAVLKSSPNPGLAHAFVEFLAGDQARALFLAQGFTPVRP